MSPKCKATPIDPSEGKVCKFCGRPARYVYKNGDYYCEARLLSCPAIKEKCRITAIETYKNNPKLVEIRRRCSKEVHNRPEVKKSKSEKIKQLHKEGAYQETYKTGRPGRSPESWTKEHKKKQSELMKHLHQDPKFREKYMRGIRKRRKK